MMTISTLRQTRPALAAFFVMGILWGSFSADLPDIKTMLAVDESRLGFLMFLTPLAAMLAMRAAPWMSEQLGRSVLGVTTVCMALAFILPGQTGVWYLFPLAMLVCGATTGAVDVLMNARVSAMEVAQGRPLMNLCHAAYSFGYAGGALGTGALRSMEASPGVVMAVAAVVSALLALAAFEKDGKIDGLNAPPEGTSANLGMIPVIGGAIVLIAFMSENAAESWSALHIEKTLNGSAALGSAGPAVLALTMGMARVFGHGLSAKISALRLLLTGAAISACGALAVALAPSAFFAYAGFIVMGIGSSVIAPTAFTLVGTMAAPEARARAVARATMLGYAGYFVGPPLVGMIAGGLGLRSAFVFTAALLGFVWLLAPLLVRLKPTRSV